MANRSDFNSILPRSTKKMLALMSISLGWTKAEARDARKAFIAAHEHHKEVVKRRLSGKAPVNEVEETTTA